MPVTTPMAKHSNRNSESLLNRAGRAITRPRFQGYQSAVSWLHPSSGPSRQLQGVVIAELGTPFAQLLAATAGQAFQQSGVQGSAALMEQASTSRAEDTPRLLRMTSGGSTCLR